MKHLIIYTRQLTRKYHFEVQLSLINPFKDKHFLLQFNMDYSYNKLIDHNPQFNFFISIFFFWFEFNIINSHHADCVEDCIPGE